MKPMSIIPDLVDEDQTGTDFLWGFLVGFIAATAGYLLAVYTSGAWP